MPGVVFQAGPKQIIVVYSPADTGAEIDALAVYAAVASDAAERSTSGWSIVSTAVLSTRHAQAFMGREGSGYETKMSVVVVYSKAIPGSGSAGHG
jgi:hypothetical protein